jgi:hypothetical protein
MEENSSLFKLGYATGSATIWQHFVLNSVSRNNSDLFKFHYVKTAMWQQKQYWKCDVRLIWTLHNYYM